MFQLLSGRHPFPTKEPSELLRAHLLTPPPPLHTVTGEAPDAELERLVATALAQEPSDRFADATALLEALALPGYVLKGGEA